MMHPREKKVNENSFYRKKKIENSITYIENYNLKIE
jgi:hypothetical protein